MGTTAPAPFWSRYRWLLPLVLVLVILGIVLGVTLGPKLNSSSASKATATPTPQVATVVVTPTPGPGTPRAAVPPTATPGGKGAATPVPGGTPVPTVPGLKIDEITHKTADVQRIQSEVNSENPSYTYYLNPIQVVQNDLPHYGFVHPFQIVSPAQTGPTPTPFTDQSGRPTVNVLVSYQGHKYKVSLSQVATHGPKGIWMIVTIVQI